MTVRQFESADPACFGGDDVTIRGWLDTPPPLGWEAPGVEPGWMIYPASKYSAIFSRRPPDHEHVCGSDDPACPWLFAHIDPASGLALGGPPRWLLLTGHRGDPAAETCHYVYPDDWDEGHYDDQDAVDWCRSQFVLVSFENAP